MYTIGRFSLQEGTDRLSLIGIAGAIFHAYAPAIRIIDCALQEVTMETAAILSLEFASEAIYVFTAEGSTGFAQG